MVQRTFNCADAELYTAGRLGWQSCEQHLAAFTGFKPRYTPAFITTKRQEITDAENLPGEQARNEASETRRIQLAQLARKCCGNWQTLKRYIADAWPPELQKTKTEAAGQTFYLRASENDWESCQQLLTNGSNFIDKNSATLTANDNMPPGFEAVFNTAKSDFELLHQQFLDSEENARIGTETKIKANNLLHTNLMSMFKDGQEIFKDEDAILKQFIFDQVLNLVSGAGIAGLRGTIKDEATGLPIAGAIVALKGTDKAATTDEQGKYIITQVAAGDYDVVVEAEGFQKKTTTKKVIVGTVSSLDIALTKA